MRSPGREAAERVRAAVTEDLARNPRQGKRLAGEFKQPLWSYRTGRYRIIYTFSDSEPVILVLRVGHRRDVSRKID